MERNIAELVAAIKHHNAMYRSGRPEIPDSVYDREVEMLRELDPDNDWFRHLEPALVGAKRKVHLPLPMKSLNKVKDIADLNQWFHEVQANQVVIMPKFDGLSLLVDEATGRAYSRGGAENEGQDCSEHFKMNGASTNSDFCSLTYGEFVFSVKKWTSVFADKVSADSGEKYKSPRNTAAGLLNRDMPSRELTYVDFYRYGIDPQTLDEYELFQDVISDLCDTYKQKPLFEVMDAHAITGEHLTELYKEWRLDYYIDGLVIYLDDLSLWDKLGRQATSGNPKYAIAYKHPDFTDTFETLVTGITWGASKSGALKPVVNIEKVNTGDCEMDSPTGYNARWIAEMKIAPGAKVLVTRSGGVIPKILKTLESKNPELPTNCPFCGEKLSWNENGVELCCTNALCNGTRLAKIIFFYNTIGCDGLGPEAIAKMYNAGYFSLSAMLDITFENLVAIDGFGDNIANIILNCNKKIREGVELPTLMQASDFFQGIGKVKAQQILEAIPEDLMDKIYNCDISIGDSIPSSWELQNKSKTMQAFWNGLLPFVRFMSQNRLHPLRPAKQDINADGKCKGMAVCFSGIRDPELEKLIVAEGGLIASGVSGNTTHLVVKDKNATSSKIFKAKEKKIPILTIEEYRYSLGL